MLNIPSLSLFCHAHLQPSVWCNIGNESGLHMREDMRGQLKEASSVTSKAFCSFRKELDPDIENLGQNSDMIDLSQQFKVL